MHQTATDMSYTIRSRTAQQSAIYTLPTNDERQTSLYTNWNENGYTPQVGQYILHKFQSQNIVPVRGDIFWQKKKHYRNDGVLIYDGQQFIALEDIPDDYGTIPQQFEVITEFPPRYWAGAIDHNEYIWLGQIVLKNLHQRNIKETSFILSHDKGVAYLPCVSIMHNGIEYYFIAGDNYGAYGKSMGELKRKLSGAGPDNTTFTYVNLTFSGMPINDNVIFFDRWDDKMSATPFAVGLDIPEI